MRKPSQTTQSSNTTSQTQTNKEPKTNIVLENTDVVPEIAQSFDELISRELVKFDAIAPAVEQLKKEFLPLTIASIEDKEGYDAVSKALRFMVSKRNEIEDKRKELKSDSIKFGKAVDERAKEIQETISPIEQHLKAEKTKIDEEVKRKEEEKALLEKQKLQDRHNSLIKAGMVLVGDAYTWSARMDANKEEILHRLNIETMLDSVFAEFVSNVKSLNELDIMQWNKAEEERAEAIRKLEEDKKKVASQLKEQEEERLAFLNERWGARVEMLVTNLGLQVEPINSSLPNYDGVMNELYLVNGTCIAPLGVAYKSDLFTLNQSDWAGYTNKIKAEIHEFLEKDAARMVEIEAEREKAKKEAEEKKQLKLSSNQAQVAEPVKTRIDEGELMQNWYKTLLDVVPPVVEGKKYQSEIDKITTALRAKLKP